MSFHLLVKQLSRVKQEKRGGGFNKWVAKVQLENRKILIDLLFFSTLFKLQGNFASNEVGR
jgi:hypothetical protein